MSAPPSIRSGTMLFTVEEATADVLARLMARLPSSLWNTDPADSTVQRDLLHAVAKEHAFWLENRTIVEQMTLLLEAQGIDLDVLLADYGLKRYLQRPDAYARQIGMHLLWIAKGTLHALDILADLLFDLPHVTLRTGTQEAHIFVADSHPVTTPNTYWGLLSDEGIWYAAGMQNGTPALSHTPPPGLNTAPGPRPLHWFTVPDELHNSWYVSAQGETFTVLATPPTWGTGTTEPFRVLDGPNGLWELRIDSMTETLVPLLVTGSEPSAYWRVKSAEGDTYAVWMDTDGTPIAFTTPPAGRDETPILADLDWFTVLSVVRVPWYVTIAGKTLVLSRVEPTGTGTAVPFRVLDALGTWWGLQVPLYEETLESVLLQPFETSYTVLSPNHSYEACEIRDSNNVAWWLSIDRNTALVTATLPAGAIDVTPMGGPWFWLRLYGSDDSLWYGFPDPDGTWRVETITPGGGGVALQNLGNAFGVRWSLGVARPADTFAISDTPHVAYEGLSTALCLTDQEGVRWFWRVGGAVAEVEVSRVLWPDTIVQMPWGQIPWLRMTSAAGNMRYLYPAPFDGVPVVGAGPPMNTLWGWLEPVPMRDRTGHLWNLTIDADDILVMLPEVFLDLPPRPPLLSMRDITQAVGHATAAGSLVTVLVT